MQNTAKTKKQLQEELEKVRRRLSACEALETERISVGKALRETEERYRSIFDSATDGFIIYTLDEHIVEANPQACLLLGYTYDELITLTGKDIVHPDYYHLFEQFKRDIMTMGCFQAEAQSIRKDGTPIDIEVKGTEFDYQGKKHLLGVIRDISERRRTEKALRESESRYRAIFHSATDAFLIFDLNGTIVEANPQACLMQGYTHDELIGLPGTKTVHPKNHQLFEQFLRDVETKGYFQAEAVDLRKDGSPVHIEVRGTTFDYQGKKHLLAIKRDITERKQAERALKKSEKALRILSSKLISVQEDEKKRIARELHDSIGQTLTAIKFGIENTIEEIGDVDTESTAASLAELIVIIQNAIDDIRKVTMDLHPTILDNLGIVSTIDWFCREYHKFYPHIRISQQITIQEREVPMTLKTTIYRIVQEAFNNIAKHSATNFVDILLVQKKKKIELVIKDYGKGFNPEKVFSKESSGQGFGLTSMSERTKLSGGTFSVESVPGEGTTLRARWPAVL
ncbi:MAG: PAS domain S-box protein [Deltaproteobacteria bacterium]|nr:PAS domain S-box protein [Deltaproteobacteria bacterium]